LVIQATPEATLDAPIDEKCPLCVQKSSRAQSAGGERPRCVI